MLMGLFPSVNRTDCKPRAPSISAWRHRGEEGGEEGTHMTHLPHLIETATSYSCPSPPLGGCPHNGAAAGEWLAWDSGPEVATAWIVLVPIASTWATNVDTCASWEMGRHLAATQDRQ